MIHRTFLSLAMTVLCFCQAARAYVDLAPTLARITSDSKQIALVEVEQLDAPTSTVTLKPVRSLKGDSIAGPLKHVVAATDGAPVPRQILQWATPGAQGVLFASRSTSLVCLGESWYAVRLSGGTWRLAADRPDLPLAYCGTVSRLAGAVDLILAGKDAVITAVPHGAEGEAASFDLALNRFNIPGLIKVQRQRINLKMTGPVMATSTNAAYVLGQGPVDEADLPKLIEALASTDANAKAEAAGDLRSLGLKAKGAAPALTKLLVDPTPAVRFAAASALLRIHDGAEGLSIYVLAHGLAESDAAVRLAAAKATGQAGPLAASLAEQLASLLKDENPPVRIAAVQAISALGHAAAKAAPAVVALLDDPDLNTDAADALGRIGPAARPIPPSLVKMLSSPQKPVQWAVVRAMAQIGGPEAHPAVAFMIKALPGATEVDGYNMMIYLSLLGPDAIDAQETVRNVHIKNPVLPASTLWAMAPEKSFPWQRDSRGPGGFGGPPGGAPGGGPGGPPGDGGAGGGLDIFSAIYEAYVDELGDRLRPVAPILAAKIMDGSAGDVPDWGYRILSAGPKEALAVLTPHLTEGDIAMRERAIATLGRMGPAALPAKASLMQAMDKAPTEREKHLVWFALRQIEKE